MFQKWTLTCFKHFMTDLQLHFVGSAAQWEITVPIHGWPQHQTADGRIWWHHQLPLQWVWRWQRAPAAEARSPHSYQQHPSSAPPVSMITIVRTIALRYCKHGHSLSLEHFAPPLWHSLHLATMYCMNHIRAKACSAFVHMQPGFACQPHLHHNLIYGLCAVCKHTFLTKKYAYAGAHVFWCCMQNKQRHHVPQVKPAQETSWSLGIWGIAILQTGPRGDVWDMYMNGKHVFPLLMNHNVRMLLWHISTCAHNLHFAYRFTAFVAWWLAEYNCGCYM